MKNLIGRSVKRKPCGRICRVVDQKPGYVKIHDYGFWTGWITKKTFETKWEVFYT
jgi:MOSC domain-containing protein YiiM